MGKKTKGRLKIKMEYISDKLKRYTTFSKRRSGIMKKAYELSTLTGTDVLLLVASETGHVYTYSTERLKPIFSSEIGRQLIQQCLGADGGANNRNNINNNLSNQLAQHQSQGHSRQQLMSEQHSSQNHHQPIFVENIIDDDDEDEEEDICGEDNEDDDDNDDDGDDGGDLCIAEPRQNMSIHVQISPILPTTSTAAEDLFQRQDVMAASASSSSSSSHNIVTSTATAATTASRQKKRTITGHKSSDGISSASSDFMDNHVKVLRRVKPEPTVHHAFPLTPLTSDNPANTVVSFPSVLTSNSSGSKRRASSFHVPHARNNPVSSASSSSDFPIAQTGTLLTTADNQFYYVSDHHHQPHQQSAEHHHHHHHPNASSAVSIVPMNGKGDATISRRNIRVLAAPGPSFSTQPTSNSHHHHHPPPPPQVAFVQSATAGRTGISSTDDGELRFSPQIFVGTPAQISNGHLSSNSHHHNQQQQQLQQNHHSHNQQYQQQRGPHQHPRQHQVSSATPSNSDSSTTQLTSTTFSSKHR